MSHRNKWIWTVSIAVAMLALGGALLYWKTTSARVYIENSSVEAPQINLSPSGQGGTLQALYVHPGDLVEAHTPVALVGNEVITTEVSSIVVSTADNVGKVVNHGETVVSVIKSDDLRVVGSVAEDKGLSDLRVGERAVFTVDAFGSRKFTGVVDEVSPSANTGDVVFSISDKRQEQNFDVKVRFDTRLYPELKNGMSAKLWIYKN